MDQRPDDQAILMVTMGGLIHTHPGLTVGDLLAIIEKLREKAHQTPVNPPQLDNVASVATDES